VAVIVRTAHERFRPPKGEGKTSQSGNRSRPGKVKRRRKGRKTRLDGCRWGGGGKNKKDDKTPKKKGGQRGGETITSKRGWRKKRTYEKNSN